MRYQFWLLAVIGVFSASASVFAKEPRKEDQWAQCLWQTVPRSAANWVAMPNLASDRDGKDKSPSELLEYRLRAACYDKLTIPGKKYPISFSGDKVRLALAAAKPAVVEDDQVDPKAFKCVRYFLNDTEMKNPAAFKWGFGDFDTGYAFASISYIYAATGGGGVGLPETGGLRKCQWINSDGTLTDA